MSGYGKRRDACEANIVRALEAAGATVTKLDGKGVPDLLVGYRGRTILIECKDPENGARNSRRGGKRVNNELGLRESQWAWWQEWRGDAPLVVTTPAEAVAVLGAPRPDDELARCPIRSGDGKQCGMVDGHDGDHTKLIPSCVPWFPRSTP